MLQTVHETLGSIVGFIYLHLKYRDRETRMNILDNFYNNAYSNAGSIILLNSIYLILGGVFGIFILGMVLSGVSNLLGFFIR